MIRILRYGEVDNGDIFSRTIPQDVVSGEVSEIIAAVRRRGDAALLEYARAYDGAQLDTLQVSEEEWDAAVDTVDPAFMAVLEQAADNIRAFHRHQVRSSFLINDRPGVVIGQKVLPIEKVGLTVPGGAAPLSSTVLMNAIPAKIAGCGLVVMVTPAGKEGKVDASVLAAAKVAGVDQIYKAGGAQGIAALAYGTQTIPRVDKIVGPGGAYVSEAKKQVFGQVSIDMIAGPSEILIIADSTSDPRYLAADMLSQAEHDTMASAVLVTDSMALAEAVQAELERQLPLLPREKIARASVENNGKIIVTDRLETAIDIANEMAPEHLELCVDHPFDYLDAIRHAGSVFMGRSCPEAVGDYFAGVNHTLPTSGTARFSSPLSVDDFVKKTQFTYYTPSALKEDAQQIARFAQQERLQGHARSVLIRGEETR